MSHQAIETLTEMEMKLLSTWYSHQEYLREDSQLCGLNAKRLWSVPAVLVDPMGRQTRLEPKPLSGGISNHIF